MKQKYFLLAFFLFLFGISAVFSAEEILQKPIFATIIEPNHKNPVFIYPGGDPIVGLDSTFAVKGIAQPNTDIDLYAWAIIPGTDGRTSSDVTITNFNAQIQNDETDNLIHFTWQPRDIFNREMILSKSYWKDNILTPHDENEEPDKQFSFAFNEDVPFGKYESFEDTCEAMKVKNPSLTNEEQIPEEVNCFFTKPKSFIAVSGEYSEPRYHLFDQIVDPENEDQKIDLYAPADAPADVVDHHPVPAYSDITNPIDADQHDELKKETVNVNQFDATNYCEHEDGSAFPVGWLYRMGPFAQTTADGYIDYDVLSPTIGSTNYLEAAKCEESPFFEKAFDCGYIFPNPDGAAYEKTPQDKTAFCLAYSNSQMLPDFISETKPEEVDPKEEPSSCDKFIEDINYVITNHTDQDPNNDNADIVRKSIPESADFEEVIWQRIEMNTSGFFSFTDDFVDSHSAELAFIPEGSGSIRISGVDLSGQDVDPGSLTVDCTHNTARLSCSGNVGNDIRLIIEFPLQAKQLSGTGKRKLSMGNRTNTFEIKPHDEGKVVARLSSPRYGKVHDFSTADGESAIQIPAYVANNSTIDLQSVVLNVLYDPNCLWVEQDELAPDLTKLSEGNIRTISDFPDGQNNSFNLLFHSTGKECFNTKITLKMTHHEFGDIFSEQYLTITNEIGDQKPLLQKKDSDPEEWEEIAYYFFAPHFLDSANHPELVNPEALFSDSHSDYDDATTKYPLATTDVFWADNIIFPGKYRPNVTTRSFNSHYLYQYANYMECEHATKPNTWVYGFMPIKEMFVLVDGFHQYEIYGVPDDEYIEYEGVTRENGYLLGVLNDPSAVEMNLPLPFSYLDEEDGIIEVNDPSGWHFAIFEVREIDSPKIPPKILDPITRKYVANVTDASVNNIHASKGHLISSAHELHFSSGATIDSFASRPSSPEKVQWEIYETSGGYFLNRIYANEDGEIRMEGESPYGDEVRLPKRRLNRFALQHFLSAVYYSTDTRFSQSSDDNFHITTNRSSAELFNVNEIVPGVVPIFSEKYVYGSVFDAWTKEPLSDVELEFSGNRVFFGTTADFIRLRERTSSDGFFTFPVHTGKNFSFDVLSINHRNDTFSRVDSCAPNEFPPFTDAYCSETFEVLDDEVHYDIPVRPNVFGTIKNVGNKHLTVYLGESGQVIQKTQTVLSDNGNVRFSFYVPADNYQILRVENEKGRDLLNGTKSISSGTEKEISL